MLSEYENNLNVPLPTRTNKRGSIKLLRDNLNLNASNPKEPNETRESVSNHQRPLENGDHSATCCHNKNTATNINRNSRNNQEISVIENADV